MMKNSRLICPSLFPNCFRRKILPAGGRRKRWSQLFAPEAMLLSKWSFHFMLRKHLVISLFYLYLDVSKCFKSPFVYILEAQAFVGNVSKLSTCNLIQRSPSEARLSKLPSKRSCLLRTKLPPCNLPAKQKRDATVFSGCFFSSDL